MINQTVMVKYMKRVGTKKEEQKHKSEGKEQAVVEDGDKTEEEKK